MPPGQRCSVCREQGHNRVTCGVAQRRRDEELGKLRHQIQRLRKLLKTVVRGWGNDKDRADEQQRRAVDAELLHSDAAWRAEAAEGRAADLAWELDEQARAMDDLTAVLHQAEEHLRWLEDERERMSADIEAAHRIAAEQGLRADVNEAMAAGYEAEVRSLKEQVARLRAEVGARSR